MKIDKTSSFINTKQDSHFLRMWTLKYFQRLNVIEKFCLKLSADFFHVSVNDRKKYIF